MNEKPVIIFAEICYMFLYIDGVLHIIFLALQNKYLLEQAAKTLQT